MYNALEVAWKMLQLAKAKGIALSNLQLQKLVYIAHGYFLGWRGTPLIQENVEAWNYGPVIPSIYHDFKANQSSQIQIGNVQIATALDHDNDAVLTLQSILDLYGRLDAMALVNLTHQKNTPWDIAWNEQGGSEYYSYPINNEIIKNHFRKVINDPTSVSGL